MITFHQKVTNYPQLVNKYTEIILILQNMLIYMLFIDCRESHLRAFCRQIHQCARIWGWEGGVKPILEMPGFWKRLSLKALPKGGTENIQSFVTFWLWTVSLRVHLLIRKPSQDLIAEFVLKN